MRVNLCPPFLHGAKVTSRVPSQLEMTVVVRGTFRLAPGEPVTPIEDLTARALQGDLFADTDDERTGALLHASDFADFKFKTDLLLRGTCYPGEKRAAAVCTARFAVGAWSKSLRIFGRRMWTGRSFDAISEPAPFTSMPITYENAFGGPEFPRNPVGKGFKTTELPTVEDLTSLIGSRRDTPEPAGFGPISPNWPQRSAKVGTDYGVAWKKTRAPFYSADFDWSHFNSAPPDQQLGTYLRGDESLLFEYLHPRSIRFAANLPGVRPRVVCRRTDGFTTEVPMNLDTLLADLDGERLVLLWRGLAKVNDDQLDDVRTLLLGCETLAEPKPAEHYLREIDAFEKDPVGFMRERLLPAQAKQQIEAAHALKAKADEETKKNATVTAPDDPAANVESMLDVHAKDMPPDQRNELVGRFKGLLETSKSGAPERKAQALASGMMLTTTGLTAQLASMIAAQKADATARGLSTAQFEAAEKQIAQAEEQQRAADAAVAASGKPDPRAAADAAAVASMAGPPKKGAPEEAPGPGANLMGRDLSGWDLRGFDLHGALLHDAKLVGTRFGGANLSGADLGATDLTDADLTGADLSKANLTSARAPGAVFDEAKISLAIFMKADLTSASMLRVEGKMIMFQETLLTSVKFCRARLHKAAFSKANLDDSDFTDAELDICMFQDVQAARARFDGVRVFKTSFLRSRMTGASFIEASGEGCSWQETTLDGADFRYAKLRRAQLNKASLLKAKLHASDFKGGRFERALLADADFSKANLMSVSLNKAKLAATNFSGANLYDAKFLGAVASVKCNFDGANLTLAIWEQP